MKKVLTISLIAFSLFLSVPQSASAVDWFPIVPCGLNQQPANATRVRLGSDGQPVLGPNGDPLIHDYTQPCNQCLLVELGKNMIDFTFFGIVPMVGTLFFVWAGFMILWGGRNGDPGAVKKGRHLVTQTAIGIAIILSAWTITTFILKTIANEEQLAANRPWYQIQCRVGTLKDIVDGTSPSLPTLGAPGTGGTGTGTGSGTGGTGGAGAPGSPGGAGPGGTTAAVACLQSGLNLCQGSSQVGCASASCGQYGDMINRQAKGAANANVLKAFMEVESSCNIAAASGTSYGLMQLTPPIPQIYASRCGVSPSVVDRAWLTNPANAEKSICIAVQWINSVAASQCGSSIRNLYAGYNGGPTGACSPSANCAGETSCSGEPVKRWECLYDDKEKKICNGGTNPLGGYNQTRQGATRIMQCAANPGF